MMVTMITVMVTLATLATSVNSVDALKRKSPLHSDVIEEVEAKRLEKLIQETDFIAVFFCKFLFWNKSFWILWMNSTWYIETI